MTGIPRVKLNAQSSFDEVCTWLVSLGLSHCTKKFVKKKVTGAKLFNGTEKKLRKLVKSEDDFILVKRALRQAKAYAATIVPDVIVEEPNVEDADQFVQVRGRRGGRGKSQGPFRSVRRENPLSLYGDDSGGGNDYKGTGIDDEYLSI